MFRSLNGWRERRPAIRLLQTGNMTLAISSYEKLPALSDQAGLLNLAWALDERALLAVDLAEIVRLDLAEELRLDLPFVNSYFVQDPYGESTLGGAVARFFSRVVGECGITCGAGVNSLLHGLAQLTNGRPVYVIGDVYPDFPHWTGRSGGVCLSRYDCGNGNDHIGNVRASGASVVLVDRPVLIGEDLSLAELKDLCDGVASSGACVVVDESYANYCPPAFSAVGFVTEVQNLAVVRGLSKAYGLGGLRLAYCVTSAALTERVRSVISPLLASSLSLRIGRAILDLGDVTRPLREGVPTVKAAMIRLLEDAGLAKALPSREYLPYVFCGGSGVDAQRRFESLGIIGKLQPFWTESARAVRHVCRLSVPLSPARMDLLVERIGTKTQP